MALILYQDPRQSETALYRRVLEHLRDPRLQRFRAIVAYVRWEGLSILADAIEQLLANGGRVDTIFGVDNGVTTPDALLYAHYLQRRFTGYRLAGVFEWPYSNSIFHPKLFQFDFQDRCIAIVGSANLTGGGIFRNHELCTEFTVEPGEPLVRDLRRVWRVCAKDVTPITPSLIRRLTRNARLSSERTPIEQAERGATPWKRLKVRTPPKRKKPLFAKILTTSDVLTKHEVLAEADSLSEKPRRLYLQILHETGGGHQVQLPVATLGAFFGVGKGQSKRVEFQFGNEITQVHLTHFGNNTHRVRLRPLQAVPRPAVVVFSRSTADRYRCTIVPRSSYRRVLSAKCREQTRRGSRKWGLEV
jgi:HKD family nuclease